MNRRDGMKSRCVNNICGLHSDHEFLIFSHTHNCMYYV